MLKTATKEFTTSYTNSKVQGNKNKHDTFFTVAKYCDNQSRKSKVFRIGHTHTHRERENLDYIRIGVTPNI